MFAVAVCLEASSTRADLAEGHRPLTFTSPSQGASHAVPRTQKANEANVSSSTAQGVCVSAHLGTAIKKCFLWLLWRKVNQSIEESTRRAPLAALGADEWLPAVVKAWALDVFDMVGSSPPRSLGVFFFAFQEVGPFGAKLEVTDPETSEARETSQFVNILIGTTPGKVTCKLAEGFERGSTSSFVLAWLHFPALLVGSRRFILLALHVSSC